MRAAPDSGRPTKVGDGVHGSGVAVGTNRIDHGGTLASLRTFGWHQLLPFWQGLWGEVIANGCQGPYFGWAWH